MKHSVVPRKPSTKPTSTNSESGHFNSFLPIPPKIGFSDSWGRDSKQSSHGRLPVLLRALFLAPRRRVAPPATAIPAGGAPRAPIPRRSCQAWLGGSPSARSGFQGQRFCSPDEERAPAGPSNPTSGCVSRRTESRVCTATFAAA